MHHPGIKQVQTLCLLFVLTLANHEFDLLAYVNPLIGSKNEGNVFAGATLPYGLAKAVADVDGQNTGGFGTDGSNVTGFSSVHDSGTGGNPSLGNFPLFPQVCPDDELNKCRFLIQDRKVHYKMDSVVSEPGHFGIELHSGIQVNMTVSDHAALYRFKFPRLQGSHPLILLDLTDLWRSRQNASISIDEKSGSMVGNGTFLPSFGAGSYQLYFCVDFFGGQVHDTGVWVNSRAGTEPKQMFVTRGFNLFYLEAGGFARFTPGPDNTITARVGISFKDSDQACRNAKREIPDPLNDFNKLVKVAKNAWREKLKPISIKLGGADKSLLPSFYSGVYRNMISPQNYTGENPHWDTGRPYFDSYYCIWDSFRASHPLLNILDPQAQAQIVQSLLDIYKHEGWLPDCHMSMCQGWTQGGSNADIVLVDFYVKNISSAIDWEQALAAIVNDAENEPLSWSQHGRGGLQSWKKLDYIPFLDFDPVGFGTNSRSVSRTIEYSYDDFCVATLAGKLGRHDMQNTGYKGFLQPKYLNGTWGLQDPIACSPLTDSCSLTSSPSETFEASIWQYMFFVPHAMSSLIALMGGDADFVSRLDFFFESGLADISNEPVFLAIYLYHYAGRPALSAERIHTFIPAVFNDTNGGLPGNDDSGAMGALFVFATMGLFPVAGQNVYLISPPFFQEVSVRHPVTGKTATIRNVNFDPSYRNLYIQRATVNGVPWTKSWIGHEFFTKGWTLELTLGSKESDWGQDAANRPPSWVV